MKTKINEIFSSIQGEGPVVGYKQLFIRFCKCNLNCLYCDTKYHQGQEYTPSQLAQHICAQYGLETFHSISLTGGEPLLEFEFLKEFLPLVKDKTKIYLETNATLANNLSEIKEHINIISADIKLPSATGKDSFELHKEFFKQCDGIQTFAKIVFDNSITEDEIEKCIDLGKSFDIELILQPKMIGDKMAVKSAFCNQILDKFTSKYKNTRLIPQVHKFLDVR